MASLRKRNDKWQAQVRRLGHTPRTKTFINQADALRCIRQTELELDRTALTWSNWDRMPGAIQAAITSNCFLSDGAGLKAKRPWACASCEPS